MAMTRRKAASGLSLVELMVAMALTLMLAALSAGTYLAGARGSQVNEELTQLHEQARLAFEQIGRDLRQAGYTQAWLPGAALPRAPLTRAVLACDKGFAALSAIPEHMRCATSGAHAALAVRYETSSVNVAAGQGTNCLGNTPPHYRHRDGAVVELIQPAPVAPAALPADVVPLVGNFYFITHATRRIDGQVQRTGHLSCAAIGETGGISPSQPLFAGVEDLQLRFVVAPVSGQGRDGEEDDAADSEAVGSVEPVDPAAGSATEMSASELNAAPERWENVVAVRVCLLMRTASKRAARMPQSYLDCHGRRITPESGDASLWRAWTETFALRNRADDPDGPGT